MGDFSGIEFTGGRDIDLEKSKDGIMTRFI